jgi:hypothetical protein
MAHHEKPWVLDLSGVGVSPLGFCIFFKKGIATDNASSHLLLEWTSSPSLVAFGLIAPNAAESPGSGRQRTTVTTATHGSRNEFASTRQDNTKIYWSEHKRRACSS